MKGFLAPEDSFIFLVTVPIIIMTHSIHVMSTSTFVPALSENNIFEVKSIVFSIHSVALHTIHRGHSYRDNLQSLSHTL